MTDETQRAGLTEKRARSFSARGEFDFLESLQIRAKQARPSRQSSTTESGLITGIGDDAAVIKPSARCNTVITADLLVEDIDFRRDTTRPGYLGHKSLAVSLSDIAAMGARPRWALSSLGVPQEVWDGSFVDEFYDGLLALAAEYDVALVGGDVSRTPDKVLVDSIVLGEVEAGAAILRSGARQGDEIFVTGTLGTSAAALRLLERGLDFDSFSAHHNDNDSLRNLLFRHLRPEPRVGWGIVLGKERLATAMIDISDGLSSDLHHLCSSSGVGALICSADLPVDPLVQQLCGRRALDPLILALHGGEDFELLFTVSPGSVASLPRRVDGTPITHIGTICAAEDGVCVVEGARVWALEPLGWEHFTPQS